MEDYIPTPSEAREYFKECSRLVGGGANPRIFTPQHSSTKLMHNYDVTDNYEQIVCYLPQARRGRELFDQYASNLLRYIFDTNGYKHKNLCPHSTRGCRATCLGYAGRLASPPVERAMLARYVLYVSAPAYFWVLVQDEIKQHGKRVNKHGKTLVVRINGTSDIDIVMEPDVYGIDLWDTQYPTEFQDYTKRPISFSGRRHAKSRHYIVRSVTENDGQDVFDNHVGNLVVPVNLEKDAPLPATFMGRPVVDGDKHDLRLLDDQQNNAVLVRVKKRNDGVRVVNDYGFIREV